MPSTTKSASDCGKTTCCLIGCCCLLLNLAWIIPVAVLFSAAGEIEEAIGNMSNIPVTDVITHHIAYISSSYYPAGDVAEWGANDLAAVKLAIDDANQKGWCGQNCRLELTVFEANGTILPPTKLNTFITSSITNLEPIAFIGADWSRVAVHTSIFLKNRSSTIPIISSGATSAFLEKASDHPNFLRTVYSDRFAPKKLFEIVAEKHAQAHGVSSKSVIKYALVHTTEPYGTGAATVIKEFTAADSLREMISEQSFESDGNTTNIAAIRPLIRNLLNISTDPKDFFIYISSTGPDTTRVFGALAAEGISAKNWTVCAIEAADSVAKKAKDIKNAAGYFSYLAMLPEPDTCPIMNDFATRFEERYNKKPTGGFAEYSYDLIVLIAAGIRAARGTNMNLLSTLRSPNFQAQGLTGIFKFPTGENQAGSNAIAFLELMDNGESKNIESGNDEDLCPANPIGLID